MTIEVSHLLPFIELHLLKFLEIELVNNHAYNGQTGFELEYSETSQF